MTEMYSFLFYNLGHHPEKDDARNLGSIDPSIYTGIAISGVQFGRKNGNMIPRLKRLTRQARRRNLRTIVMLDCFQDEQLYQSDDFTPPVAYHGAMYQPVSDYFPICPNNPVGLKNVLSHIDRIFTSVIPDYLYLDHFHFPFDWKENDLDIQDDSPRFCYCPFCTTEFSSVVGEIITSSEQIDDLMPEWLEWRTDAITQLILEIKRYVAGETQMIVGVPPLAMIDLPFSVGLLPHSIVEERIIVSPQFTHIKFRDKQAWIDDILDQYQIDLNRRKIWPFIDVNTAEKLSHTHQITKHYGAVILTGKVRPF